MSEQDQTQEFLNSLPELEPGKTFGFACHPQVRCFNACCGDLNLMLTPYDVLRLRRALGHDSKKFIHNHADISRTPGTGFPMCRLRMLDNAKRSCPFVRAEGCSVYENRPGACRTYPLGRASRMGENGEVIEQFFIVQEPHCRGFEEKKEWTSDEWLKDQGLEAYNAVNDRYMRIMNRTHQAGAVLDERKLNMAFLALYQVDNFTNFIKDMNVFSRLDVSEERQQAILTDEEECLNFALDWVELLALGSSENLQPK
ncbi:YkgJ family cysteine cluster protein [Maridesulfovibrio sp.]|uniref:YkgJ family cysteine cluster protein n=1 Tax=Maridesulfovibrio sp. TaxID=2795000 RepID=UPI002A18B9E9|nr:YkgJ family cysteine cluster protein [Maridesulfovibrio sp.]